MFSIGLFAFDIQAKEFVVPATREEFEGFEVPKVTYGADQE